MYSTNNEKISRTLKNKIYKSMTSVSKNVILIVKILIVKKLPECFLKKLKKKTKSNRVYDWKSNKEKSCLT